MKNNIFNKTAAFTLAAVLALSALPFTAFAEEAPAETEEVPADEEMTAAEDETPSEAEEVPDGVTEESGQEEEDPASASYVKKDVRFYVGDMETNGDFPLYFVNDVTDLPYMNLYDWIDVMATLNSDGTDSNPYQISLEADGPVVLLSRENGFSMMVDFEEQKILFDDYDGFTHPAKDYSLLDIVVSDYEDENGNPLLIDRVQKGSFDRYGKEVELDLAAYQINLYWSAEDQVYLVPMQTLADFLISPCIGLYFVFNGEEVFWGNDKLFGLSSDEYTPLGMAYYYSVENNTMSDELAWYSYCELCLALDNLYGLKDIHGISSFDEVFKETGYRNDLASADPNVKDGALMDFLNYYLDDLHTAFSGVSYLTESADSIGGDGLSASRVTAAQDAYLEARENADHPIPAYEEVGNTAYVTFDEFIIEGTAEDYYSGNIEMNDDPATVDTIALVLYAHEQITRENSPIENVVIDLSINGGGAIDAAALISAWFLGESSLSIRSSMTGATSTGTYKIDANLDGVFDEKDSLGDKNLFCLTGPYSFSCGNLVPSIFKTSGRVTLIGKQTGGGTCVVLPMSTAYGSMISTSSPRQMSYLKNGSYYDIDTGIEPDSVIVKIDNFYDRASLTEYINGLF